MTIVQLELLDDDGVHDTEIVYAFRNKSSGLYVGYDGYDTDFKRGISDFIKERDLVTEFNKKLITRTHDEIIDLLTNKGMKSKEWDELGGFKTLEIVRMEVAIEGRVYTPLNLLNLILAADRDENEIDYEDTTG
jgi:hypothetical protein